MLRGCVLPRVVHMEHEHAAEHRSHRLVVVIEPVNGLFEGRIEEPGAERPHFSMAGPPRPYAEVVEEVVDALRRHLTNPGE
jgi:hypothetical protein